MNEKDLALLLCRSILKCPKCHGSTFVMDIQTMRHKCPSCGEIYHPKIDRKNNGVVLARVDAND